MNRQTEINRRTNLYLVHGVEAEEAQRRAEADTDAQRAKRNKARRDRHAAYSALGLKKVKGALGGTYYE